MELHRARRGEEPGDGWAGGGESLSGDCLGISMARKTQMGAQQLQSFAFTICFSVPTPSVSPERKDEPVRS